jgi:hypothetical protein
MAAIDTITPSKPRVDCQNLTERCESDIHHVASAADAPLPSRALALRSHGPNPAVLTFTVEAADMADIRAPKLTVIGEGTSDNDELSSDNALASTVKINARILPSNAG